MSLRIAYLLEDTGLSGGTRVVLAQADALIERGHEVTLITKGVPMTWRSSRAEWVFVDDFESLDAGEFDFVVGTFWTTLSATVALAGDRGVHLCQGYEGAFSAYSAIKPQIDAAYSLPLPKITVSPHLVDICRAFNPDSAYVGQIVDDVFFRAPLFRQTPPLRVLLSGQLQSEPKGIDIGYEAVRRAREAGAQFELVRVSSWSPADDEPTELAAEFHVGLDTTQMAALFESCDIVLGPSRRDEGFGLPPVEGMASGLAAVLASIPSFLSIDQDRDYALFVPENDAASMGGRLTDLLKDEGLRRRTAERGRQVAEQFRGAATAERLERWFLEHQRLAAIH